MIDPAQHNVDVVALQLFEIGGMIVTAYVTASIMNGNGMPELSDVMEHADWVWQYAVRDTMQVIGEDTGYSPTELDQLASAFMVATRRQHAQMVETSAMFTKTEMEDNDDDTDPPGGLYL